MAKIVLEYQEIIEKARKTWSGKEGDLKAEKVKHVLDTRLENYSKHTGFTKDEILIALEKNRNVNTVNYYQECNLPLFEDVYVFDSIDDFKIKYPSGKSICPACGKESTNFYQCTQPKCDWKVYGLLSDLGKGIKVIIKDKFLEYPKAQKIFKPVEHSTALPTQSVRNNNIFKCDKCKDTGIYIFSDRVPETCECKRKVTVCAFQKKCKLYETGNCVPRCCSDYKAQTCC